MFTRKKQQQHRADSRLAPSQRETLQSNAISYWLGANLESALPHSLPFRKSYGGSFVSWRSDLRAMLITVVAYTIEGWF